MQTISYAQQCIANPTYTINSASNGNYNLNPGQSLVITANGVFTGSVNMNGGTICNQGIIQSSANMNVNSGTFYNYGTLNRNNFSPPSGLSVYNYGIINIAGDLNLNSGVYWYEDGKTTVGGNMQINTTVTGSNNVCGGFQVANMTIINSNGNVSQVDVCDWGHPSNGFDVRNGTVQSSVTFCNCNLAVNPLPVQLANFEAVCGEKQITISWITYSEVNNDHFLLEKSTDMQSWSLVEKIQGAGNSNDIIYYEVKDILSSGTIYYRLTQVDVDGTTAIYDPEALECEDNSKTEIRVFPNPASDYVQLTISGLSGNTAIWSVISVAGNSILSGNLSLNNGTVNQKMDISSLAPGIYTLRVQDEKNSVSNTRLVVQ